ncbi:cation:proton antiporter [Sulfurospirillum diekertiae]|uniref:cation:proton antiporter n=1 Tax=Sulfurospirillum diekertiae TaxID=1854492 RepID=UPI001AEFB4B4
MAALARRLGAPYPVFLALGGAALAFLPGAPLLSIPPELILALFVAPVLLDAAYDASLRDLKDNWFPVMCLVIFAVGITTMAVAIVVHLMIPSMPWAVAIALGAIVSPPDAVAATAVLRPLHTPHRILTVLEGESLLNDASSLLIYRLAVGAVIANSFTVSEVAPVFLLAVAGSLIAGLALGWLTLRVMEHIEHIPTAIILQFVCAIGVWILAEDLGLSAVLTTVSYAIAMARTAPYRISAETRISTNVVWQTVVFALNIFAFIFIGLQMRPILGSLIDAERTHYLIIATVVLLTVIIVRPLLHMPFNLFARWRERQIGFNPPRPMLRSTIQGGIVISWAGMRGIVSLSAAMALPSEFPYRDLILITTFAVVFGTLVIQGLTLKPLMKVFNFHDDNHVCHEVGIARKAILHLVSTQLENDRSPRAEEVRQKFVTFFKIDTDFDNTTNEQLQHVIQSARKTILSMRDNEEIGDDAFHYVEEELDGLEIAWSNQNI